MEKEKDYLEYVEKTEKKRFRKKTVIFVSATLFGNGQIINAIMMNSRTILKKK